MMGCVPIFIDFDGVLCASWLLMLVIFAILGKFSIICSSIPSAPLSLSSSSGIPIILILFCLMVSVISQILPSWSSSCLSLFCSASLFPVIWSSISLILSHASFILAVRASILDCPLLILIAFFVNTYFDFSLVRF